MEDRMEIEMNNIRDSYNEYRSGRKTEKLDYTLPKIYLKIVSGFMNFLVEKLLEGFSIQIGGGTSMGTISIVGRKPKPFIDKVTGNVRGLAIDWASTKKMWKDYPETMTSKQKVFFTNEHTNGLIYNIVWWKTGMKIANKRMYTFVPSRKLKKKVTDCIKNGKEYLVVQNQ